MLLLLTASLPARAQPAATDFQLSPQRGQDDVQQWFDRYECDGLAKRQSGAATHAQSGPAQHGDNEEYVRAMTDCLTQHGYGVRYAPPRPQPPPAAMPYASPGEPRAVRELRYRALWAQAGGGYTATGGSTGDYINGGGNGGAAVTWFPSAALPLGVRAEGSYTWSTPAAGLLALNGVGYNRGEVNVYGGDLDLRLNLARLPVRQQLYLLGGVGWYRIDALLQKVSTERVCGGRYCSVFTTLLAEAHKTSSWEPSWNAGLGWEVALDSHTAFFIEARYRRILQYSNTVQLVPIWLGLRF
jgi:hypothetical protein